MNLKRFSSLLAGKLIQQASSLTGTGATAAPGLYALKIDPKLIASLSRQLEKNIIITGTNGKTTTARMISQMLENAGISYIHNRAGSNLLRGIASTLIKNVSLTGKIPSGVFGLWEVDEAVLSQACQQLKPDIVIINNLFRDQLDRYGEIDTIAKLWQQTLESLSVKTIKIINADDPVLSAISRQIPNVCYFGLDPQTPGQNVSRHSADSIFCYLCGSKLVYRRFYAGHLGIYSCPKCPQLQPEKCCQASKKNSQITIESNQQKTVFKSNLPGLYNLYNFSAAACAGAKLKLDKYFLSTFANFRPAFGRVEKIKYKNKTLRLFLVKNPTGFNQVIATLINELKVKNIVCLIAVNDFLADGRDVSWLWDVDFEKLTPCLKQTIISGTRARDMALRLKYCDYNNYFIQEDLKKALDKLLAYPTKELIILPTYTAMLALRKLLGKENL